MIKELVKDDAVLSVPCEPATAEDAPVAQDLVDTLASIEDAVCLAANQIGVTKAIVAYQDDDGNALWTFNARDANKALELLGKHLDMFGGNKVTLSGGLEVTVSYGDDEDSDEG